MESPSSRCWIHSKVKVTFFVIITTVSVLSILNILVPLYVSRKKVVTRAEGTNDESPNIRSSFGQWEANSCLQLMNMDPFDEKVVKVTKKLPPLKCQNKSGRIRSFVDNNGFLKIDLNTTNSSNIHCLYNYIVRSKEDKEDVDNTFSFTAAKPIHSNIAIKLKEDFVYISCESETGRHEYENFHMYPVKKISLGEKINKHRRHGSSPRNNSITSMNVVMILNDAVSMGNAIRHLPKTYSYLTRAMLGIPFHGYHTVGDNSYPNIAPLLAGLPNGQMTQIQRKSKSFDFCPFVWNGFSANGYVTYYLEDKTYATFNFNKPGFRKAPTDYYTRPFWLAMETSKLYRDVPESSFGCLGNQKIHCMALDYLGHFLKKVRDTPHFAFHFLNEFSHNTPNRIQVTDHDHYTFLKKHHLKGNFNNTLLMFMSDHGARFGEIRKTPSGRQEHRFPMLVMVLPPWLQVQFPEIVTAMRSNSQRLVTPYDLHATLVDVIGNNKAVKNSKTPPRGLSLFKPIPESRTCAQAGVPKDLCLWCRVQRQISKESVESTTAVDWAIEFMNRRLSVDSQLCQNLTLSEIKSAHILSDESQSVRTLRSTKRMPKKTQKTGRVKISKRKKEKTQRFRIRRNKRDNSIRSYYDIIVDFVTFPGEGLYEAVIRLPSRLGYNSSYDVTSVLSIIRLSVYGSDSKCYKYLKDEGSMKYCSCKPTPTVNQNSSQPGTS
ncbi:uncharacterized protein LOC106160728 [Lingula anatina]|uniref:Uncharacterized protein LOC106160728 n=1 Tax=Lingula anatina TaxID=7574 RepID=A0A1S3I3K9_LINAN|nr:uncharacterized protein LOC106160728 [Lingula anatina]|eukprot:XP_013392850.1 uncharacterized protein LOC106160728 [Lingula anatina]